MPEHYSLWGTGGHCVGLAELTFLPSAQEKKKKKKKFKDADKGEHLD